MGSHSADGNQTPGSALEGCDVQSVFLRPTSADCPSSQKSGIRGADGGLKRLESSLIHTPNPNSRSLGVRSVIEEAEDVIVTERTHLEDQ